MSNPEKKWFVYAGVQQEGPLSVEELRERIAAGRFLGAHLAWCEGMPTWLKADEIEILRTLLQPPVPVPPPIPKTVPPGPPPVPMAAAQPAYQPQPIAPQPAYQPQPVAPQPVYQPQPVTPQPAYQPQPVTPQPAYQPQPVTPQPAYQPQPVAPQPVYHPQSVPAAPSPAPTSNRERTITNLLNQARHHDDDELETDLTPDGLLIEDDDTATSSVNLTRGQPIAVAEADHEIEKEELSALIYMNADAPEEKTSSFDAGALRKAHKEAAKATKIAQKSSRDFEKKVVQRDAKHSRRWLSGGILLILGGSIGTGMGYGYQWVMMNQHWFRKLPETAGVRTEERTELQNVIGTSLSDSVRLALAMSQDGARAPSFFVASNLPDGALVDVFVHGEPDSLLGQAKFDVILQVKLNEGIGRTDVVRARDGSTPPVGRYVVTAVDADPSFQSETVRTALAASKKLGQLPSWIPSVRRTMATRNYVFLLGKTQANYDTELKDLREKRNKGWLDRFKQMADVHETLSGALNSLQETVSIAKSGNGIPLAKAKVRWESKQKDTLSRIDELNKQASEGQSADQVSLTEQLKTGSKSLAQAFSLAVKGKQPAGYDKNVTDAANQLSEFKKRLEQAKEAIDKLSAPSPGGTQEGK